MRELVCPSCGKESMVSLECVYQHYSVWINEDGDLDYDGHVLREWTNDNEPPSIQCTSCGYDCDRDTIIEHMKEIEKGKKKDTRKNPFTRSD